MNKVIKKLSIAILHSQIRWGGGEAVTFWTIYALKDDYDITLITFDRISLSQVNKFYGLDFKPNDFKVLQIPLPFFLKKTQKAWLLKQHLAMRCVKKLKNQFVFVFGTYNEIDFDKPGIQYIHFPVLAEESLKTLGVIDFENKWYHRGSLFREAYKSFCTILSGFSVKSIKQNLTLVNSEWTGSIVEKVYGIKPIVVYPPVKGDFLSVPWKSQEEGFVCIGRISPEKNIEAIIEILKKVRALGNNINLHIIGQPHNHDYGKQIKQLVEKNNQWIDMEEGVSRKRLVQLLSQNKFGIHGMKNEHFGIAVAEMVKAGMIVFVPNDGGQVEIVNHDTLTYDNMTDAVNKIHEVLKSNHIQATLHKHLKQRALLFSEKRFMKQIKKIVADFIDK